MEAALRTDIGGVCEGWGRPAFITTLPPPDYPLNCWGWPQAPQWSRRCGIQWVVLTFTVRIKP